MNLFPGRLLYRGLFLLLFVDLFWVYWTGRSIALQGVIPTSVAALCLFLCTVCLRRIFANNVNAGAQLKPSLIDRFGDKILVLLEGFLFIALGWISLRLFNHLSMTTGLPYQDAFLATLDVKLGLDWNSYFRFVANSPFLVSIMDWSYGKLTHLTVLGFVGLVVLGEIEKARFFMVTFVITALFCTMVGMFFPAKAAVATLLEDRSLLGNFAHDPGTYSVKIIHNLRTLDEYVFYIKRLPGLTTFPSFHTAAGVVLAYSYRGHVLFLPVLVYTLMMIASTPVYGGHYFIDLIAGTICALVICRVVETRFGFNMLFGQQKRSVVLQKDMDLVGN